MILVNIEKARAIALELAQKIADMGQRSSVESQIAAAVSVDELKTILSMMKVDK